MPSSVTIAQIREKYADIPAFLNAIQNEAKKLCRKNPEFIYMDQNRFPSSRLRMAMPALCNYTSRAQWRPGEPAGPDCRGCVYGQSLRALGWNAETEMKSCKRIQELIVSALSMSQKEAQEHSATLVAMQNIQRSQDRGSKWGELFPADSTAKKQPA